VAYLKILDSRYLKRITNKQSRLYCVIAAYNTGAGNVAKTFTGKTRIKPAAKIINKMTPDEVYNYLRKHLPYEETQRYIVKVTKAKKKYSNWDR
jgi:membrane-bound lytic murein transglycosylase C